jgi:3-hydroxyisobutyrate dehydrogenase-like beta-hydroxyacid dehydrogenase
MKVGFIGLGNMGRAMAANLLKAGHAVAVYNRSPEPARALGDLGARIATDVQDTAAGADVLVSMLADDAATRAMLLAPGALDALPAHAVHVDMATLSVELVQELARWHQAHGTRFVAAPVFGRVEVAQAAKLFIIAAGAPAAVATAQPLFDAMGQRTFVVGVQPHQASSLKIAGNFMIANVIELLGEAFALAAGQGVPIATTADVLTSTLFSAPVFKTYAALITERRYQPVAFRMGLGLKDVKLALAAAEAAGVPLPLASLLRDRLLTSMASGHADLDWSALAELSFATVPALRNGSPAGR